MQQLRTATAALHQATEMLPLMQQLGCAEHLATAYPRYLSAQYKLYRALEPLLYARCTPTTRIALGVQPKWSALAADLATLDIAPPPPAVVPLLIVDEPTAVGGLYVLEGATLGGQVIARQMRALNAELPLRFLECGAAQPNWRQFGIGMSNYVSAHPGCEAVIVAGAQAVFAWIYDTLAKVTP